MTLHSRSLYLICLLCLCTAISGHAAAPQYAFRILFTDKAGSLPTDSAHRWLSARALARRAAYHIALDSTDRPVSPAYVDSVLRLTGGRLHNTSRWLNQCVVLLTDSTQVLQLAGKPFIRSIAWVGYFGNGLHLRHSGDTKSEKEAALPSRSHAKTTGSSAYYGATWTQTSMVGGDYLHDLGFRGAGQIIAVLDEGFTDVPTHPGFDSMRAAGRLLETYDFVHDTAYVFTSGDHGTQCLSTIAGLWPGTYIGSAPRAAFALYTTEDGAFTDALYEPDNLVAGMERADSLGADVIACSLGYNTFESPYTTTFTKAELDGHTTPATRAANLAVAKGMLYVSSAGNEGNNSWNFLLSPSDADSALTVGSVMGDHSPSSFSSPGPNSSGRVKPDVCLIGGPAAIFGNGGSVTYSGGTSFAAPQAAGYAACLKGAFPGATPGQIRDAISRSADHFSTPTPKLGYGIPNFRKVYDALSSDSPAAAGMLVYPNPFGARIIITLPAATADVSATLIDALGRSVRVMSLETTGAKTVLTVPAGLPAGFCMLRVQAGSALFISRLIHL